MVNQNSAPIYEALKEFNSKRVVPFDVPGHKRGRGNPELTDFLGQKVMDIDVNSMKPLDNLNHPKSVIKEAEFLAAQAFRAHHAFFMVNGTTSSVQAMVFATVKRGDKIILPRNVHRSVLNALVLCGAYPIYINPEMNQRLGISLGMSLKSVKKAINENPDAKAIFVNNPTYYGICSDLKSIVSMAHEAGLFVLADEAHGTHLYFGEDLPQSAMAACCDMSAVSMHKSGGSLTQSSILLTNERVNPDYMRQVINLTSTTSASYLLLSSLDLSRKHMVLNGKEVMKRVVDLVQYAREEVNEIGDYWALGEDLIDGDAVFDFDQTKLTINTLNIGLAGIEVYDLLRDEYDIQMELGDIANILAYVSVGDRKSDLERLVSALVDIRRRYKKDKTGMWMQEYINPELVVVPQDAFYGKKEAVDLLGSEGRVCTEFVMAYPPGIPILAPGERITMEIINYISYAKEKGCLITGTEDLEVKKLNVLKEDGEY